MQHDKVSGITPHGGQLIQQEIAKRDRIQYLNHLRASKKLKIDSRVLSDLELIATGAYSPLNGFMNKKNYLNVLKYMRLVSGLVWSVPITLPVGIKEACKFNVGDLISLIDSSGSTRGTLFIEEIYEYNKNEEAQLLYRTTDDRHPGVKNVYQKGDIYLAGPIQLIRGSDYHPFNAYYLTPLQTRQHFSKTGWRTIAGFQTRNPIHRAHEYIQKVSLEWVDGLLIHPLVGQTKPDDIPAEVRMESYKVLIKHYFPPDRVKLSIFPAAMRYAGPREAIFHAIVRKNYGCTHFIVGRDHAGAGNFYGPYDAQKIFSLFKQEEIGIIPIFFDQSFYCKKCSSMTSSKVCPHSEQYHIKLSGTRVRSMLRRGKMPPPELTRPEVAKVLIKGLMKRISNGKEN